MLLPLAAAFPAAAQNSHPADPPPPTASPDDRAHNGDKSSQPTPNDPELRKKAREIMARVLDEGEFLSSFGLRSLSRYHLANPFILSAGGREWTVRYEPAESTTRLFGGNSNWRGPIWFPTAFMLITVLRVYDRFFGEGTKFECPTGSGNLLTLNEVAVELGRRMCGLFLPDAQGRRPTYNHQELLQQDPSFRDLLMFHEFFNGDTGEGLGASHQTGWTGLVTKLLEQQAVHRRETAGKGKQK